MFLLKYDNLCHCYYEDKCTKNLFACEYVVNNMRHLKTCGIIKDDPISGITEVADPLGVICGVTPVTNPTSTSLPSTATPQTLSPRFPTLTQLPETRPSTGAITAVRL